MVNARKPETLVQQIKRYSLCALCAKRNGSLRASDKCDICRGLMVEINNLATEIALAIKDYEFETFLIGAILPTQLYEREDAMRARLKIRGRESIKSQLTGELGQRLALITRKRVDYLRPDLTISISIDKEGRLKTDTRARPLLFIGRYKKTLRGVQQKQTRCPACQGKGCPTCNNSGLSGYDTVEGIITKRLLDLTGGKTPKFSWIGSEDRESLVCGRGRPFYVQIFDPKKKSFMRGIRTASHGVSATLRMSADQDIPETPRFFVRTRILVRAERPVSKDDLRKLKQLAGCDVSFESKSKVATKRVHAASVKRIGDYEFYLTIDADGGLGIKQFVGGEQYTSISVSGLLGCACTCVIFDILSVTFLSSGINLTPA